MLFLGLVCVLLSSCSPDSGTVAPEQDDICADTNSSAVGSAPATSAPPPPDFKDLPKPPKRPPLDGGK